jgi:acetate kinase
MLASRANDRARLVSRALRRLYERQRREGRTFGDEPTVAKGAERGVLDSVILTLNAGSSSLKFAAFRVADGAEPNLLASGQIEGIGATAKGAVKTASGETTELSFDRSLARVDHTAAMGAILDWLKKAGYDSSVVAVGHRIVHGGPTYAEPVLIDGGTLANLRALIPLAPLHQPHNVAGVEAAMKAFPSTPQVACFDTAFHRSHPFINDTYALPRSYYDEGVRRYGFHGLSYEFITRKLRTIAPQIAREDVIIAHLGNGASMCAVHDGRAVATTMGFTALDGLSMGTRCGQIDPGVVLYLMTEKKMSADAISDLLWKDSGLKGMSGLSQDMRELEASDSPAARDAIAYFVSRIRRELASLAATVNGAEAIVFTAGIGEHSWKVREAVLKDMEWMGVHFDTQANRAHAQIISAKNSPTIVFVIPTNEELMIAEHTVATAGVGKSGAQL